MMEHSPDVEHVRRAILAAHEAAVRSMNARSRRAQLKNIRQVFGELETALEVLPVHITELCPANTIYHDAPDGNPHPLLCARPRGHAGDHLSSGGLGWKA